MATFKVKFSCGCGKGFTSDVEAGLHSDTTGHKMDVNGQVLPDKEPDALIKMTWRDKPDVNESLARALAYKRRK